MLDRIDRYLAPNVNALNLRAQRSEVLSANLANSDTPNYKARDFDFRAAMTGALNKGDLRMARTSPEHLDPKAATGATPRLQYRMPAQSSIDGNTVESDAEIGRFSDNAIRYQAALSFTSQSIRALQTALQGQ
ncbi:MAG: flagellar basal body rod protein FlgB [Betaproteobacteria bacterium]